MYTIIQKIELEDTANIKYTDAGYTTIEQVVCDINKDYDSTLGAFLGLHRTELENGSVLIDVFFNTTPFVYEARYVVDTIEGLGLTEITNTNQL
jgi:hypothetical protein|tara:strand:- start:477 stop:758 length:282 start_codon:yes stop_codon:yes gene_type:complete